MILHENMRYADLIVRALDFGRLCLKHSLSIYPYALVSVKDDVRNIFLDDQAEYSPSLMIEQLELKVALDTCQSDSAIGILVYAVTVVGTDEKESDALMLSITDSSGANTLTIYPYTRNDDDIEIGTPYTCDFSN